MSNSIDGRAIGRVISDWNACYPATTLRIDAITRDTRLVYSAQLGFPDGSNAEFDVTEEALRAPAIFPKVLTRRGPSRYSEGQWMLFDELSDGAFKVITRLMGEAESTDLATRPEMARVAGYSPKG